MKKSGKSIFLMELKFAGFVVISEKNMQPKIYSGV